jgi:hypothetical protein
MTYDDDFTLEPDDIDQYGNRYAMYDEYLRAQELLAQQPRTVEAEEI